MNDILGLAALVVLGMNITEVPETLALIVRSAFGLEPAFAGGIGAAAAWNIWSLIGFRALSGAGGALFPLSFAIIQDEFPPERAKVGMGG